MGDWSSVTEDRDNCPTRDLRFSSTEDMSSVTGDIAPFNGDVDFVYIFVELITVLITLSAVCSQKMYFFVMKIAIFLI